MRVQNEQRELFNREKQLYVTVFFLYIYSL